MTSAADRPAPAGSRGERGGLAGRDERGADPLVEEQIGDQPDQPQQRTRPRRR